LARELNAEGFRTKQRKAIDKKFIYRLLNNHI